AAGRPAGHGKGGREAELGLKLPEVEGEKRRIAEELAAVQRQIDLEKAKAEQERLRAEAAAAVEDVTHRAKAAREERDVELFRRRREAENVLSEEHVRARLAERLPEIAAALPKPYGLKVGSGHGAGQTAG